MICLENIGKYCLIEIQSNLLTVSDYLTFTQKITSIIDEGANYIVICFAPSVVITGSFLGFLVEIISKIKRLEGNIVLISESTDQLDLFKMAHIDQLVRLFLSKDAFKKSLNL